MDDPNLAKARAYLAKFERFQREPIGLKALVDGLALLSDLSSETNDEDTATNCRNTVRTYQTMIENEATRLLNTKDSVGAEERLHWYKVMGVFEESGFPASESFHSLRQELCDEEVLEKLFEELSSSKQQEVLRVLKEKS